MNGRFGMDDSFCRCRRNKGDSRERNRNEGGKFVHENSPELFKLSGEGIPAREGGRGAS
jgi:hypothetical protein